MRPVNIQYRLFNSNDGASRYDLQKTISLSLDELVDGVPRRNLPKHRQTSIDNKGEALLNRHDQKRNWNFGELALFNPGQGVPVLVTNATAVTLNLQELSLADGQHLIKGVMYYLSCGNHLVYIQPPNMSVGILQKYLEWLTCDNGERISSPLMLEAKVSVSERAAPQVRSIGLTRSSSFSSQSSTDDGTSMRVEQTQEVSALKSASSGSTTTALDMARAAGMSSADLQLLANIADDGELVADLRLKLVKKGKTVKFDKVKASSLLSNQEDDNISLYGENGKYTGDLTRLVYKDAKVNTIGEFLEPSDCKRVLVEAYNFFRTNGHIDGEDLEA